MKKKAQNIVLIGAGNVATQLGLALRASNNKILQVYSKRKSNATTLAKQLHCDATNIPSRINKNADIYIIAVKDDAISTVIKSLMITNKILLHTSGSMDMKVFNGSPNNVGVFYPLQTFSKNKTVDFKNIPICLEADNAKTLNVIKTLAKSISKDVQIIDSEQRQYLHVAAVFACNFSNHFYAIAEDILKGQGLSLNILKPLIVETAHKIKSNSPASMQTGPAIRGDKETIKKHLKKIENKEYKKLYQLISKSIVKS